MMSKMAVLLLASSYQRIAAEVESPMMLTFGAVGGGGVPRNPNWRAAIEVTLPSG